MNQSKPLKDRRIGDPFRDRRSGNDRRRGFELGYFAQGGIEKRRGVESRTRDERRDQCTKVSDWSSVCLSRKSTRKIKVNWP